MSPVGCGSRWVCPWGPCPAVLILICPRCDSTTTQVTMSSRRVSYSPGGWRLKVRGANWAGEGPLPGHTCHVVEGYCLPGASFLRVLIPLTGLHPHDSSPSEPPTLNSKSPGH